MTIGMIIKNRLLQHLLFWLLAFYVLLRIFSPASGVQKIDFIYTLIFIATLLPGIYLNLLFLIPRFLSRRQGCNEDQGIYDIYLLHPGRKGQRS